MCAAGDGEKATWVALKTDEDVGGNSGVNESGLWQRTGNGGVTKDFYAAVIHV